MLLTTKDTRPDKSPFFGNVVQECSARNHIAPPAAEHTRPAAGERMSCMTVVIPSECPGGLNAAPCGHFGHCPAFTLLTVKNSMVLAVDSLVNIHADCRNCHVPVRFLWDQGITDLLVCKMGVLPLRLLTELGVSVYFLPHMRTVRHAAEAFLGNRLRAFRFEDACNGECDG